MCNPMQDAHGVSSAHQNHGCKPCGDALQHDVTYPADKRERYIAIEHEIHNELVALAADAQVRTVEDFTP